LNDSKICRNLKYENHLHHILTDTGVSFVETDIKYIVGWLVMTDGYGMKTYCLVTALMVWLMNGDSEQRSEREGDGTMKKNGVLKLKKKR
jgi:hypothetical protein